MPDDNLPKAGNLSKAGNPLHQAHRLGIQAVNDLGVLFGQLGTTAHPNSTTLVAYRAANRALRDALRHGGSLSAVRDITRQLRLTVGPAVGQVLRDAADRGHYNAARQLEVYNVTPPDMPDMAVQINAAYGLIDASLQRQEAAVMALMLSGADEGLIVGDNTRQGVLKPVEVILQAVFWTANLWWEAFLQTANRAGGGFYKQAVAALDARTTDCCLRVHGQVQRLDAPFSLTGTPRFADEIDWPPFHHWCRTSGVLYLANYDDGLTEAMRDSAAQVMGEREAGLRIDRLPADAFI